MDFSKTQLANYLSTIFVSTPKEDIQNEIENDDNKEKSSKEKAITIFLNFVLSNNAENLVEKFSSFQANSHLKKLKFFKREDIEKLPEREQITTECFQKIYKQIYKKKESLIFFYNQFVEEVETKTGYPPYYHSRDIKNRTLLVRALRAKNPNLALLLLEEEQVYPDSKIDSNSPFWPCIFQGNKEILEKILAPNQTLESKTWYKDKEKRTALHMALYAENKSIIEFLVEKHPYLINQKNIRGKTALYCACDYEDFNTVNLLIENKADVNLKPIPGRDLLTLCCKAFSSDEKIKVVSLLLKNNFSLKHISLSSLFVAIKGDVAILKELYKHDRTIFFNEDWFDILTAHLIHFRDSSFYSFLKFLKKEDGLDQFMELEDVDGRRILSLMIEHDFTDCAKFLIKEKADLHIQGGEEFSSLDDMVRFDRLDVFKYAIDEFLVSEWETNKNPTLQDSLTSIMILALDFDKKNILEYIDKNEKINKLFKNPPFSYFFLVLAQQDKIKTLESLRKAFNIPLSETLPANWNSNVCTLTRVLERNQYATGKELIKIGATYNDTAIDGKTRLHFFIETGKEKAIDFLLEQENIDINIKDLEGKTPLTLALEMEHFSVAELLIKKDPSVLTDPKKLSALLLQVVNMKSAKTFKFFLQKGSENYTTWKKAFQLISDKINDKTNKTLFIEAFLECCELREEFFNLSKKNKYSNIENTDWERKPQKLLDSVSLKKNVKESVREFLFECKTSLEQTKILLPRLKKRANQPLKIESYANNVLSETAKILHEKKVSFKKLLKTSTRNILEQSNPETIENIFKETKKEFEKIETQLEQHLKEALTPPSVKLTIEKNPLEEILKKQQKENETLKSRIQKLNEEENQKLIEKEKENKELKKRIKKLEKLLEEQSSCKQKSYPECILPIEPQIIIENNPIGFIEPKNNNINSLKECIENNCERLIRLEKKGLDFQNIISLVNGSLKTRTDIVTLLLAANFQESTREGSHGTWNNQNISVQVTTHEGKDNKEIQKKRVLIAIIDILKKT